MGIALQSGHDAWAFVEFSDIERILKCWVNIYRERCSAEGTDLNGLSFGAPEALCVQDPVPS